MDEFVYNCDVSVQTAAAFQLDAIFKFYAHAQITTWYMVTLIVSFPDCRSVLRLGALRLRVPREECILRAWSLLSVAVRATVASYGLPLR